MRKQLLTLFIVLNAFVGKGQNLVPNGNFEQFSGCPTGFSQIDSALFWMNPSANIGSPDYYNQCSIFSFVDVPDNFWGYQPALSGDAYSGIYIWVPANLIREYIETPFTEPLSPGTCYHFEMYINLPNSCQYTTDAIGIYFSDTAITGINNYDTLPFTPQINNVTGNIPDTLNWILVSGNYTANGGENYLIIGNFKGDSSTNAILINSSGTWPGAYFFIDDVSLTPCATGINETVNNTSSYTISPNPAGEELNVQCSMFNVQEKEIKIYDMMGKEVLKSAINLQSSIINIQSLNSGIYFIEINGVRKKFVKN